MHNKKTIAVIFGGQSVEHDVSIITAHIPVIGSLRASRQFDVFPVYIARDGSWYSHSTFNDLDFFKRADIDAFLAKQKKLRLLFDGGLWLEWPGLWGRRVRIDVAFPAMHGTLGEDGSLMGLLRMAGVPFVGCDIFASAVAMDKSITKRIAAAQGIPVIPDVVFTRQEWKTDANALRSRIKELSWPVFVKPVHLGSSIALAKAKQSFELENAIEAALHYDDKILVEESIEDPIEVTLPIMGNDVLQLAGIERPLHSTELFDFNEKYLSGNAKGGGVNRQYSEIPARLDNDTAEQVISYGKRAYRALGCEGIARIDFLIKKDSKQVYLVEVNTLPGSLYCHNWRKVGISNSELVTRLIMLAEERFAAQKKITHAFRSNILQKAGGKKFAD